MPIFVFYVEQFLKSIKWLLFISILFGQPKPKIVHTDVISESEKMEATFIFDEVIDRDDVSGWIDRNNYFTLSLFNVSFDSKQKLNKEFKYPLISIETVDTDNDGIGDNAETDDDGDTLLDADDAFPLDATETVDTDNDGTGDNTDTDDDGDGVLDTDDAFPLDATEWEDVNGDGLGDNKNELSLFDEFKQSPTIPIVVIVLLLAIMVQLYRRDPNPSLKTSAQISSSNSPEEE